MTIFVIQFVIASNLVHTGSCLNPKCAHADELYATVDGVSFRDLTIRAVEHEINSMHHPEKRNYGEGFDEAPFISSVLLTVKKITCKYAYKM